MLATTLRTGRHIDLENSRSKKEKEIERKINWINVSAKTREMGEKEKEKETRKWVNERENEKVGNKEKREWKE